GEVGVMEMGQGTFLDIAHGTYPDVTSSATTIPGGLHGAGLSQSNLAYTILVNKGSYFTRVGNGPFPTEMKGAVADSTRQAGNEFGTTTGRPRRCGYVDLPLLRSALELNGADCLCLTKLDITSDEPFMLVNTDYGTAGGEKLSYAPNIFEWRDVSARVEMLPSWKSYNLAGIKEFRDLPIPLQSYLNYINDKLLRKNSLPIASVISIGKSLEDMVITDNFLQKP
ncbi:MAG: adenylosuccinate synthetase, partial [Patescibacteria group bacterium]